MLKNGIIKSKKLYCLGIYPKDRCRKGQGHRSCHGEHLPDLYKKETFLPWQLHRSKKGDRPDHLATILRSKSEYIPKLSPSYSSKLKPSTSEVVTETIPFLQAFVHADVFCIGRLLQPLTYRLRLVGNCPRCGWFSVEMKGSLDMYGPGKWSVSRQRTGD